MVTVGPRIRFLPARPDAEEELWRSRSGALIERIRQTATRCGARTEQRSSGQNLQTALSSLPLLLLLLLLVIMG